MNDRNTDFVGDFDPDSFMQETIDKPLDFERTLVPEGEFKLAIDDFTSDAFETFGFTYKKGPNKGEEGKMVVFTCPIIVLDDKVKAMLQTEKPLIYHRCTLDFEQDAGMGIVNFKKLAFGPNKNIELGKLRHATGQGADTNWQITKLRGSNPFMGKLVHANVTRKDGSVTKVVNIIRFAPIR